MTNTHLRTWSGIPKWPAQSLMLIFFLLLCLHPSSLHPTFVSWSLLSVPCTPLQLFPYHAHTHTITYIIQIQVIKKNREIKLNVELLTSAIHYRICTHCLFPTAHYHLSPCWSWWYFNPILTVFDTSHNHILRKAGWRISAFNVRISALRKVIFYSLCFESGVQRGKGEKILDV